MKIPEISKDNCFTAIRMMLCLIVIYEHAVRLGNVGFINLGIRTMAVNCFFCISGFWITISYLKSKNTKEYFRKRARKIYPAYIAIICAQILLGAHFSTKGGSYWIDPMTWKYFLCNALFMNFLSPKLPGLFENNYYGPEINGALWTMKIEVGFYIILPLIMMVLMRLSRKIQNTLLTIGYVLAFLYIAFFYLWNPSGAIAQLGHQLPAYMGYFFVGMIYVNNYDWIKANEKKMLLSAVIVVFEDIVVGVFWIKFLLPAALMVLIGYVAFNCKELGMVKTDYSYIMYLTHFPIIQLMYSLGYFKNHQEVAIIMTIATSFFIAYLSENCSKTLKQIKMERKLITNNG